MKSKISFLVKPLVFGCCLLALGCTPKKIASDITAKIMAGGAPSVEREPDVKMAETTGLTMIKMLEAFQFDNPKNKTLNILLSRSYANYAFGFLEWNMMRYKDKNPTKFALNQNRAKRFYDAGKRSGINALKTYGGFRKALNKDLDSFKKHLKGYGKSRIPALFWTAFNWGSVINMSKDSPEAIISYPKVEAMMERVLKVDQATTRSKS